MPSFLDFTRAHQGSLFSITLPLLTLPQPAKLHSLFQTTLPPSDSLTFFPCHSIAHSFLLTHLSLSLHFPRSGLSRNCILITPCFSPRTFLELDLICCVCAQRSVLVRGRFPGPAAPAAVEGQYASIH